MLIMLNMFLLNKWNMVNMLQMFNIITKYPNEKRHQTKNLGLSR
jgi:hypothetical protein